MNALPPQIVNSVAFIGSRDVDGVTNLRGTACFIVRRVPGIAEDLSLSFAVTARHVLEGIYQSKQQGCLRMSVKSGGVEWLDFNLEDWVIHPDLSVDAAVLPMKAFNRFDVGWILQDMVLTEELVASEAISVGAEVFMTGLFVNRPGRERNIPIVRVGNIAAMPVEKVSSPNFGEMDGYLIEARSIGGLSGSPTFVHLGIVRMRSGEGGTFTLQWANNPSGVFYWMGIVHGHYDGRLHELAHASTDVAGARERVNTGIAVIVPATRIMEIFEVDRIKTYEARLARALQEWLNSPDGKAHAAQRQPNSPEDSFSLGVPEDGSAPFRVGRADESRQ